MSTRQDHMDDTRHKTLVTRTTALATLTILFLAGDVLQNELYTSPVLGWSALAMALSSILYLIYAVIFLKNPEAPQKTLLFTTLYWIFLMVLLAPFVYVDVCINAETAYKNVLLLYSLMVYAPVSKLKLAKQLYIVEILYVILIVALAGGSPIFCLRLAGIGIGAAIMSYSLHSGYFQTIKALRNEGNLDGMTQLYSKTAGVARMNSMLSLCRRMNRLAAIYFLDIDHFKSYNDTYGHGEGDRALIQVANTVKDCFSRDADIVCRMGGEEFAVMVAVSDEQVAIKMGKKLGNMISDLKIVSGVEARLPVLTISTGVVVVYPQYDGNKSIQELLDEADRQLYIAKSNGRNCVAMDGAVVYRNPLQ